MGRVYEESSSAIEKLVQAGKVAHVPEPYDERIEVGAQFYPLGELAFMLQRATHTPVAKKVIARFMSELRQGKEYCRKEGDICIIYGPSIPDFLHEGLKDYVHVEGQATRTKYDWWKSTATGTYKQRQQHAVHRESVEDLVSRGEIVHLPVIDDKVVLLNGECDEEEFFEKIEEVSGRRIDRSQVERRQTEFYRKNVYTIHNALLGPPHEVRAIETARAVELLPPGFEQYYIFESKLESTG